MRLLALVLALLLAPVSALAAASCANEPMRATGTTYYVCDCQTGAEGACAAGNTAANDTNLGTSPSAPWRSWAKAISTFNSMAAGSTVAFCKGGAWRGLTGGLANMRNVNCQPTSTTRAPQAGDASTCDMRDYTPSWGGTNKPILQFTGSTYAVSFGWYEESGGGWSGPRVQGVRILNLDFVADGSGLPVAINLYGRTYNVEICSNTFRDGWANSYTATTTISTSYVHFHHNRITNNPFGIGQIVGTGCPQDCWFDSNYLDLNGGGINRDHSIYLGGSPYGGANWPTALVGANPGICYGTGTGTACYAIAKNTRVTNNEIRRSAWGAGTGCVASAVVAHGPHEGLVIENNLIYEPAGTALSGCYGIDITAGVDMPGYFDATVIRRNQIIGVNGNGITTTNCRNCIIENNFINGGSTAIRFPQSGNRCTAAAYPPTAANTCSGQLADSGGIARNNTVVNAGDVILDGFTHPNSQATNNAVCGGAVTGAVTSAGNRAAASSCLTWFQGITADPSTNRFQPAAGSVLIGAGSATTGHVGTAYLSGLGWSATEAGVAPDSPPTQGAARLGVLTITADPPANGMIRIHGTKAPGSTVDVYRRP